MSNFGGGCGGGVGGRGRGIDSVRLAHAKTKCCTTIKFGTRRIMRRQNVNESNYVFRSEV